MKRIFVFLALLAAIFVLPSCDGEAVCEHSYNETVHVPTCLNNGYTEKVCTKCSQTEIVDYVSPTGHAGEWKISVPATCTTQGTEINVCTVCDEIIKSRALDKTQHTFASTTVAPTCKDSGYELHLCTLCGYSEQNNFKAPTGVHTEGNGTVAAQPDCNTIGKREYYCKICNTFLREENIDVTEHDYMILYSQPSTEGEEAFTMYKCTICHDTYKGDYVPETIRANEIYDMLKDAMLEIIAKDKNGAEVAVGSGFFVSSDGCIVTNYHVIEAAYSLDISKYDGTKIDAKLIGYDIDQDIAILKAEI
ncbi:MAG: serine protease [Clostridia bacterium]|nr:serine protease [Clostridia bacterium]